MADEQVVEVLGAGGAAVPIAKEGGKESKMRMR